MYVSPASKVLANPLIVIVKPSAVVAVFSVVSPTLNELCLTGVVNVTVSLTVVPEVAVSAASRAAIAYNDVLLLNAVA